MKNTVKILAVAFMAVLVAAGCGSKEEKPAASAGKSVVGQWHLQDYTLKSVLIGSETVDVWLSLAKGGSFTLWQMLGEGRYRVYQGTWKLSRGVLSGTYSDGNAWGASYKVTQDGDRMELEAVGTNEVTAYVRASIPDEVKEFAY